MKSPLFHTCIALLLLASCSVAQDCVEPPLNDRVIDCLKRRCQFDFSSASVDQVAACVEQQFGVNVIADKLALKEVGLDELQLTFQAKGISLRSALLLMLEPFDLAYIARLESIVLTTKDRADEEWRPVVYDVTGLIRSPLSTIADSGHASDLELVDFDGLIGLVEQSVMPDTWSVSTGPSPDAVGMTINERNILVIRQSEHGHLKIENFLAELRRKCRVERTSVFTEQTNAPRSPSGVCPDVTSSATTW